MGDLDHGPDVCDQRASRTGRADVQVLLGDLLAEREDVFEGARTGARQTDVGAVDTDFVQEMEDLELVSNSRVDDGWILDSIPERLIVEFEATLPDDRAPPVDLVPIVDQLLVAHQGILRRHGPLAPWSVLT